MAHAYTEDNHFISCNLICITKDNLILWYSLLKSKQEIFFEEYRIVNISESANNLL